MLERNKKLTNETTNKKQCLLTNIILNYIHKDNAEAFFCAKMNGFESNGTTKNEMFREISDYLSYFSIIKKAYFAERNFMQHKFKLPRICATEKIGGVQYEASSVINIFGNEAPPSML